MKPIFEASNIQYGVCEASDVSEMVRLLGEVFNLYDPPAEELISTLQSLRRSFAFSVTR